MNFPANVKNINTIFYYQIFFLQGRICRGKVMKFWLGDKNFPRRIFPDKVKIVQLQFFTYTHEIIWTMSNPIPLGLF